MTPASQHPSSRRRTLERRLATPSMSRGEPTTPPSRVISAKEFVQIKFLFLPPFFVRLVSVSTLCSRFLSLSLSLPSSRPPSHFSLVAASFIPRHPFSPIRQRLTAWYSIPNRRGIPRFVERSPLFELIRRHAMINATGARYREQIPRGAMPPQRRDWNF